MTSKAGPNIAMSKAKEAKKGKHSLHDGLGAATQAAVHKLTVGVYGAGHTANGADHHRKKNITWKSFVCIFLLTNLLPFV